MSKAVVSKIWLTILGWLIGALFFYPIYYMAITAFKTEKGAYSPDFFFTPTLESFGEVFSRSDYFLLHPGDSQRLSDGFLSNAEIAVDHALDVIDQNDAGGGRPDPYLHYLAVASPFGHCDRVDHHLYLNEPADRRLEVLHLFL